MSWFKKIKGLSQKVVKYSADELIADTIIIAAKKQEKVNIILQKKGCLYRIDHLELDIDFPPSVLFKVSALANEAAQPSQQETKSIQATDEKQKSIEHH